MYKYLYKRYFIFSLQDNYFSPVLGIFFPISFKIRRQLPITNYFSYTYAIGFLLLSGFMINLIIFYSFKINLFGIFFIISILNLFIRYASYRSTIKFFNLVSYLFLFFAYIIYFYIFKNEIILFLFPLIPFFISLLFTNHDFNNWIKFKNLEFNLKLFPIFFIIYTLANQLSKLFMENKLDFTGGIASQRLLGFESNSTSISLGTTLIDFNLIYFLTSTLIYFFIGIFIVSFTMLILRIYIENKFQFSPRFPKFVVGQCKIVYKEEIFIGHPPELISSKYQNVKNIDFLLLKDFEIDSFNQVYYCNDDYLEELRELIAYLLKNMIHISINKELLSKYKNEPITFGKNELNKYDLIEYVIKIIDGVVLYGNIKLKKSLFNYLDGIFDSIGNGTPIYMTDFMSKLDEIYINKKLNYFRSLKGIKYPKSTPSLSNFIIGLLQIIISSLILYFISKIIGTNIF